MANAEKLASLTAMGFSEAYSRRALEDSRNDLNVALTLVMERQHRDSEARGDGGGDEDFTDDAEVDVIADPGTVCWCGN